jgi:secreted trypsin-like serine protease
MAAKQYCLYFLFIVCTTWTLTTSATISTKIVGGKTSIAGQWPWIVALVRNGYSNYEGQFCGGSLISPTWVVTAAHCLENTATNGKAVNVLPNEIHVVANTLNLKTDLGQSVAIKRIIRHPLYNTKTIVNDIALLQLQKPVVRTKVLPLVIGNSSLVNVNAAVVGWGALSEALSLSMNYPEQLFDTNLPIIPNQLCQDAYSPTQIAGSMLCAGYDDAHTDTCTGDSGGPLIIRQNNQWRLAGITSWGNGCANPGYYGVYTRVSKYATYINNILKINFFTIADFNHDKIINALDKTKKYNTLKAGFQTWVKQCWVPKARCADINANGIISLSDYTLQNKLVTVNYNYWVTFYWQPEAH